MVLVELLNFLKLIIVNKMLYKMLERLNIITQDKNPPFLTKKKEGIEPFFNQISDPLIVVDEGFIIKSANPSAASMFNISDNKKKDMHSILNYIDDDLKRQQIEDSIKDLRTENNLIEKVNFSALSSSKLSADVYISKNKSSSTKSNHFTLLIKKDEVLKKREELNQLKSEFLAQMSHEIRTPLGTMLNFTNLIHDEVKGKLSEELDSSFDHINIAGKRIIRTIDLLLNLSEIHAGTYEYLPSNFDLLDDLVFYVYKEYKNIANKKGLDFYLNIDENDYNVYGDHFKIEEIFKHLIENAIHFTKTGSITLKLFKDKRGLVSAKIIDTGIGISESYLPMLYEPFTQEEQGYSRSYEGNGVGLTLVKNYCELNNIKLHVSTKKNIGTCFSLFFEKNREKSQTLKIYNN